ncbi:MAG: PAS domain-containing protein [Gemmatimonadaceae bacterium]|nr:PAS domain-containing protein [Gemmatimonadaceae bacterium]
MQDDTMNFSSSPEPPELRNLPGAALLIAPDGHLRGCNAAFTALTGHTAADLAGQTLGLLFGSETDQGTAEQTLRAIERGDVFTGEVLGFRRNGAHFWCDLTLWPTRDGFGAYTHIVALLRDVTARRIAQSALVAGSDLHGLVLDRIPAGIVIHKWTTEILYANAKATELLGITYDRILGVVSADPRWVFMSEDGLPLTLEDYPVSRVIRTRAMFRDMVIGVRRPDGLHDVWLMGNGYPVLNDDGEPIEVVISFTDVTRIKAAERALQKSEERLTLVLQGSTDASWDLDLVADALYYSPRWWEMVGYAVNELTPDPELWIRLLASRR